MLSVAKRTDYNPGCSTTAWTAWWCGGDGRCPADGKVLVEVNNQEEEAGLTVRAEPQHESPLTFNFRKCVYKKCIPVFPKHLEDSQPFHLFYSTTSTPGSPSVE